MLGLHTRSGRTLSSEQMNMLETFASQTALAVEVDRLTDEARKAQVEAETEKSRSALLSSVSHDLRTPLAAICGAAGSLLDKGASLFHRHLRASTWPKSREPGTLTRSRRIR